MRWPWQRSGEQRSDAAAPGASPSTAAAPDAPPRVPPAGWAFLPPLQRQVSDAPPAVLRPAFVSSLPTRVVPASLGSMGHLVDDGAPAGTVAVDGGALGVPVQRAVTADLALRPGRVASPKPVGAAGAVQRATDAAGPGPLEVPPVAPGPEVVEMSPDEAPLAEDVPVPGLDEAPGEDAPAPGAAEAEAGPGDAAPASTTVEPAGAAPGTTSSSSAAPPPASTSPPLVRPTLQRSVSPHTGSDAPNGATPEPIDVPPLGGTTRRVGLGAPLPSRPLQRTPTIGNVPARTGDDPRSTTERIPVQREPHEEPRELHDSAAVGVPPSGSASPGGAPPLDGAPLIGEVPLPGDAPLLGEAPLAVAADSKAADGTESPARPATPPAAASPPMPLPMPTATVQRETSRGGESSTAEGARPPVSTRPASPPSSAGSPAHRTLQRSVALAPARAIMPALGDPTMGAPVARPRGGPVVVARVVAPTPPSSPAGSASPTRGSAASTPPAVGGASSGWSRVTATPRDPAGSDRGGSVDVERPSGSGTTAAAASVARLSTTEFSAIAAASEPAAAEYATATAPPSGRSMLPGAASQAAPARIGAIRSAAPEPMPVASSGRSSALVAQRIAEAQPGGGVESPAGDVATRTASAAPGPARAGGPHADGSGVVVQSAPAPSTATPAPAPPAAAPENVEQLVRKLYGPLVRRIKAELLLDRERRGIRIDGI